MRRSNAKPQAFDPPSPKMEPSKPHLRPKLSSSSRRRCSPSPLLLLLSVLALAFLLLYLLLSPDSSPPSFSIIIDGGSTGTRIHVFAYRIGAGARDLLPVVDFGLTGSLKVGPGLSFYADEAEEAGESLMKLVEFAKGRVPRDLWAETEIRLMGTAGLRLVDAGVREVILESCRRVLRGSGFRFEDDWATVITGNVDGLCNLWNLIYIRIGKTIIFEYG